MFPDNASDSVNCIFHHLLQSTFDHYTNVVVIEWLDSICNYVMLDQLYERQLSGFSARPYHIDSLSNSVIIQY